MAKLIISFAIFFDIKLAHLRASFRPLFVQMVFNFDRGRILIEIK